MNVAILDEPELEFAGAGRHIDPRFGIVDYGPADAGALTTPTQIRVGIVGTARDIDGVRKWFERCQKEIPRKPSHQAHLFPSFPGFNEEVAFRSTLVFDGRLERTISQREIEIATAAPTRQAVEKTMELYRREIDALADERRCDVVVCARPDELHDENQDDEEPPEEDQSRLNFHDLLKARAMPLKMPFQVIRRRTWDRKGGAVRSKKGKMRQGVQDEATRAWNLHAALYYKAGGVPWRMARASSNLASCYVGVSFYKSLSGDSLQTSVAQVFNERGDGVIVRGGQAAISEDRQPHLPEEDASSLLQRAFALYREEHHTLPARLVIHKSSRYTEGELRGFREAARKVNLHTLELLWIPSRESTRLFRAADNPPLRGTMLSLDAARHVLYTRGSVDFYAAYPGMYVPHPLGLRLIEVENSPEMLANEVLALTKMNWNDTQLDGREPITLRTADQVGSVLRYVSESDQVAARYSYYM